MPADSKPHSARQSAERIREGAEKLGLGAEAETWLKVRMALLEAFGMADKPIYWRWRHYRYDAATGEAVEWHPGKE